jgi:Family of unknown function (DUF6459)
VSVALDDYVPHPTAVRALRLLPVPDRDPVVTPGPQPAPAPWPGRGEHQLRLVVADPVPLQRAWADPVPTALDDLPDVAEFARQLAQAVVDILAGHRSANQLVRWARPDVFDAVRRRAALNLLGPSSPRTPRTARRPVVRSVRTCDITRTAVEASAVVVEGDRARALAMRLEGLDGRWRLAALVIG